MLIFVHKRAAHTGMSIIISDMPSNAGLSVIHAHMQRRIGMSQHIVKDITTQQPNTTRHWLKRQIEEITYDVESSVRYWELEEAMRDEGIEKDILQRLLLPA